MTLKTLFEPKSVAIIGASEKEGSVGRIVTSNMLKANFYGKIYPINPKYSHILGVKAFPSILEVSDRVDLVVITTPAKTIPAIVLECAKKKIPTAIIISAGFKEVGEEGRLLEEHVLSICKEHGMRLLGPNCLGCMNPRIGLNASFAAGCGLEGKIAFLSQSGALCTAFLDWSLERKLGMSAFVSLGSMSDIEWSDLLEYLEKDPHTEGIFMYVETISETARFKEVAARVAKTKPIFVIKGGKTEASAKAAASHTGSLTGNDDLFSYAMKQLGICRINTIEQFFNIALFMAKEPNLKGKNLTIITNAGGPGVLSVDAAVKGGAFLSKLSDQTFANLNEILPSCWSHDNPVDVLGDANVERYKKTVDLCLQDKNTDAVFVILTPQDMTDCTEIAKAVVESHNSHKKPLFVSWMGAQSVAEAKKIFNDSRAIFFEYPDEAAETFGILSSHLEKLKIQKPAHKESSSIKLKNKNAFKPVSKTKMLSETASKEWVFSEGFPVVRNFIAKTKEEAADLAEKIGFPVVIKLHSQTITHKSDVGGVKLNLKDSSMVKKAFEEIYTSLKNLGKEEAFEGVAVQKMILDKGVEVILGSKADPQWGAVVLFGAGGEFVEVYSDRSLGLAPVSKAYALEMIKETKIYSVLQGARGRKPCDLEALADLLVKFSEFISGATEIDECDLNPLIVTSEGSIALDARIVLK